MRALRKIALPLLLVSLLLLSGCDVWDMIMQDMLRDILSKLNPFNWFTTGGSNAVPPTTGQIVGTSAITAGLMAAWAAANGAFQGLFDFLRGAQGTTADQAASDGAETGFLEGLKDEANSAVAQVERFLQSLLDRKNELLASGAALPETLDNAGTPPTFHETYDKLREAARTIGADAQDKWINISALLDKGTTARAVITGLLTMVGVSFTAATAPWIIAAGLTAGVIDKYGPDSLNIIEMFMEPSAPANTTDSNGPVFTPVVEQWPRLNKEALWKLPREQRLKMWEDSRGIVQKLFDFGESPTTVEGWERRYEMTRKLVDDYEARAKEDPNWTDTDNYKKLRHQLDLLDTLRASGPRMELQ